MVTQLWSIHNGVIGIVGFSKSIDSMTKNKSLLRSGQSGLGDKENKKGWMGESFSRMLNTPYAHVSLWCPQSPAAGIDWRPIKA